MRYLWTLGRALLIFGTVGSLGCAGNTADRAPLEADVLAAVHGIVADLASPACENRARAVLREYYGIHPTATVLLALQRELAAASPGVQRKGPLLLSYWQQMRAYFQEPGEPLDWSVRTRTRLDKLGDPGSESRHRGEFRALVADMLLTAKNPSNDFTRRTLAIATLVTASVWESARGKQDITSNALPDEVLSLLQDPDPDVSGMVAVVAAGKARPPADQDRLIISKLIQALGHPDFGTRVEALLRLRDRTGQSFCIDPSDDPPEREPGIHQWKQWWATAQFQGGGPGRPRHPPPHARRR